MSLRDKLIGTRGDRAEYKAAQRDLNGRFNNGTTDPDSTEFQEANDRAAAAAKRLPWLGR
jgi:hypothetical protein